MIGYQLTSTAIGVVIAGVILYMLRRDHIHGSQAASWLVVAAGVVILGVFPWVTNILGPLLQIAYPPIVAVLLGMAVLLIKVLSMDVEHARQERRVRRLTQRMAILESRLEDLENGGQGCASEQRNSKD